MNKTLQKIIMTVLASLLATLSNAVAQTPEVELTHWWNTPGELAALNTIKHEVIKRGGKFTDVNIKSWDELHKSTIHRLELGYPPAVTQWLSGTDLVELSALKVITLPPESWRGEKTADILFKEVFRDNQHNGKLISIPLGIHIQNSALFNADIYRQLKLPLPNNWQQFLEQAVEIERAGYVPIALSNELWQFHMVFNTILLEKLGVNNYKTFYLKGNAISQWEKELIESLSIFQALKQFTDAAQKNRSWSQSAAMIGSGSAAMHVMGDFAKGELIAKGLKAGEDFLCSLAPGSKGSMVYAIDSFVMLNVQEEYLKKGQKLLFDIVLDPVIQAAYSTKKGSIPIRHGVDASQLDSCSQHRYESWQQTSQKNLSFSAIDNPLRASFIQSMLDKAWKQSSAPEQLSRWLIDTVEQSLDGS